MESPKECCFERLQKAFTEINFNGNSDRNIYNVVFFNLQSQCGTGVPVLDLLFNRVHITKKTYRHDEFCLIRNLAGCRYRTFSSDGEGDYGILQMQAYPLIKNRFYQRRKSSIRHSFEVTPNELRLGAVRARNLFYSIPTITREIYYATHGVRVEVTLQANNLQNYFNDVGERVIERLILYVKVKKKHRYLNILLKSGHIFIEIFFC